MRLNGDKPEVSEVKQMRMLLLNQVPQTSRGGNNDLWAAFQHPLLFLLGHSPHQNGRLDVWNMEKAAHGDVFQQMQRSAEISFTFVQKFFANGLSLTVTTHTTLM